ncbi:MAG TPA: hypothetical protein VER75_07975 [Thermoleophilaceae bacterium]|nr:hypothetical protein [Thermoleophilaceae bacterium]
MSARPREIQIPVGPLVAAIGAVLLIVSLFLDWYEQVTGFTVFEFIDLLLLVLALVTLATLAAAVGVLRTPLRPGTPLVVSVLALLIVLSQLVNHPPAATERDLDTGIWLALAGAALMVAGAVLSTARIALSVEPRTRPAAAPVDDAPTVTDQPPADPP